MCSIATLKAGAQHGDNQSLVASSVGHKISPSSTNNLKDWFVSLSWGQDGLVHSYMQADVDATGKYTRDKTGTYTISPERYAFIKSEYIIYTVTQTGSCDVYLAAETDVPAVQVTAGPGGKFCVSVFRQNQEYHIINVHDWGLFPLVTTFPGGWDGMRAGTA